MCAGLAVLHIISYYYVRAKPLDVAYFRTLMEIFYDSLYHDPAGPQSKHEG